MCPRVRRRHGGGHTGKLQGMRMTPASPTLVPPLLATSIDYRTRRKRSPVRGLIHPDQTLAWERDQRSLNGLAAPLLR